MKVERIEKPTPRPTDVLVRVKACGVVPNLTNVLRHWQSWFPEKPLPELPAVFGLDASGEVAEVGSLVQHIKPGDRVYVTPGIYCGSCRACRSDDTINCPNFTLRGYFGLGPNPQPLFDAYPYGGLSEYLTCSERHVIPVPDNVSFEAAARFGYLGTAHAAFRKGNIGPGTTLLINGCTGVLGLGAVLIALGRGVTRILGTARDRARLERVRKFAGDRFEFFQVDQGRKIADWARELTNGEGVDAVIDCLGPGSSGQLMMDAIYGLHRGGRCFNIGGVGEKTVMDVHWMMDAGIEFIGSAWFTPEDGHAMSEMARIGTLDLSVFEHVRVPLAEVNRALDGSMTRNGGFTNLVVVP
jgi:alcohol dehydrogenase